MTSAVNSKGLEVWLSISKPTLVNLVPTAITAAKAAVATFASVAGRTVGELVTFAGTGMAALDGKTFPIKSIDVPTNTLTFPVDTTGEVFTATGAKADVLAASDMTKLCLSNIAINADAPGTIPVGTYCDPSATLPSVVVSAGTITLEGWIDPNDAGYAELLLAAEDGIKRWLEVVLPMNYGHIIFPVTLSSVAFGLPLDGGVSFTASGALGSKPRHVF